MKLPYTYTMKLPYNYTMKLIILLAMISLSGCFQQSNSTLKDESIGKEVDGADEFVAAYAVLNSQCISCHTGYHQSWGNYTEESDWIADDLIQEGSSANSYLVKRIRNCGTGQEADMPNTGDSISKAECDAIKDWIDSISQI